MATKVKKELVIEVLPIQVKDCRVPVSITPKVSDDFFAHLNV